MDAALGELLSLDDKVVLVTGGATGIGEGIARLLASAGARVVIGDLDDDGAAKVAAEIGGTAVHLDVTSFASAEAAVAACVAAHGGLDVLVNNAGSYRDAGGIIDQSLESWRRSIEVNLASVFNCSKPAARRMVDQGRGGGIVNIASVDGLMPCLGTAYDSAKAGVIQFTKSLALDLAPHQIRVNAIAPGHIAVPTLAKMRSGELPPVWPGSSVPTGLMGPLMAQRAQNIPLGHSGEPLDIAKAALFLLSDLGSYVTGHTIVVDGGWLLV